MSEDNDENVPNENGQKHSKPKWCDPFWILLIISHVASSIFIIFSCQIHLSASWFLIEQGNATNNTYYNASRMNTHGLDAAIKQRVTIYILELLKALTARKLGRPDLMMMPTAFGASRYFGVQFAKPLLAEQSGYLIFKNLI